MNIQLNIQNYLSQQPPLASKRWLYYYTVNTLSITFLPSYFVLIIATVFFACYYSSLFLSLMPIVLLGIGLKSFICRDKKSERENVNLNLVLTSTDEFTKNVSDWSNLNDYQIELKKINDEEVRIILTNQSKQDSTIIIDYGIRKFDECLIIEYQSYRSWITDKQLISPRVSSLSSILDALAADKFTLIISHYDDKLIDSSIKISLGENEIILMGQSTVVGESRFLKFLDVSINRAQQ